MPYHAGQKQAAPACHVGRHVGEVLRRPCEQSLLPEVPCDSQARPGIANGTPCWDSAARETSQAPAARWEPGHSKRVPWRILAEHQKKAANQFNSPDRCAAACSHRSTGERATTGGAWGRHPATSGGAWGHQLCCHLCKSAAIGDQEHEHQVSPSPASCFASVRYATAVHFSFLLQHNLIRHAAKQAASTQCTCPSLQRASSSAGHTFLREASRFTAPALSKQCARSH